MPSLSSNPKRPCKDCGNPIGFHANGYRCLRCGCEADERRARSQSAINKALREQKLTKPTSCSVCGGSDRRIEAHHEDYSKPLEVSWWCSLCHQRHHQAEMREYGRRVG